jgi:hypothetical protein
VTLNTDEDKKHSPLTLFQRISYKKILSPEFDRLIIFPNCCNSGSGFPSKATLVLIFYSVNATYIYIYIYIYIYFHLKMVIRPKHVAVTE